jgi:hypothetical protein
MSRLRALAASVPWVIAAWLVVWPPVHMVLARAYGFSSWRFAGWGMYATPERSMSDIYVFFDGCHAVIPERAAQRGAGWSGIRIYSIRGGKAESIAPIALSAAARTNLKILVTSLRTFAKPEDFDRLGRWVARMVLPEQARGHSIAVILAHPRFDTTGERPYAEGIGFVRGEGGWRRLTGRTGTDLFDDVTSHIGQCQ